MLWIDQDGLNFFQFPELSQITGLFHGVMARFCRDDKNRRSFNLWLNGDDPPETVWANRHRMLKAFGATTGIYARQVHGTQVAVWTQTASAEHKGQRNAVCEADALTTNARGNALIIQTADCQSILMADPIQRVVANIHSGWRGSIGDVIGCTIAVMAARWGCRPQNILCAIGPSLGPCCAEFTNYRTEIPARYWRYQRSENHFDFWQISIDQLQAAGIGRDHIEVSRLCTKCNQHLFFSYRGNKQTGRFASLIGWSSRHDSKDIPGNIYR